MASNKEIDAFHRFAFIVAERVGRPRAFAIALGVVVLWAVTGPLFHWNNTWQLFINTFTTVVTFLMVVLIQATQNRDARAIHLKLDELIRTSHARNVFADLEHATEEELERFEAEFRTMREKGHPTREALRHAHAKSRQRRESEPIVSPPASQPH